MIDLPLLEFQPNLQLKKEGEKKYIFDPIRKKYLFLGPEELVRQLLVQWMIHQHQVNPNRIAIEKGLKVNGLYKRCDILIYDLQMNPFLLVECKAPRVPINQNTFEQIARYNIPLQVPYLLVSNGQQNFCCSIDFKNKDFEFLNHIPNYPKPLQKEQKIT